MTTERMTPIYAETDQPTGALIINADDWGRDRGTTERIAECVSRGAVSSASAMVFMEGSDHAAEVAHERGIDTGLHLNLTTPFSGPNCPAGVKEHQARVASYLSRHPFARAVFNPWLVHSFEYLVHAQRDEYTRLYGAAPERVDGHHHMHLCSNILSAEILPPGIVVRGHFSYEKGEKRLRNGLFRWLTGRALHGRYVTADFFFSLPPLHPTQRVQHIFSLAQRFVVEVETHPVNADEYQFLVGGPLFSITGGAPIASRFSLPRKSFLGSAA